MIVDKYAFGPFGNWIRIKPTEGQPVLGVDSTKFLVEGNISTKEPMSYVLMPYPLGWTLMKDNFIDMYFDIISTKEQISHNNFFIKGTLSTVEVNFKGYTLSYMVPKQDLPIYSADCETTSPTRVMLRDREFMVNIYNKKLNPKPYRLKPEACDRILIADRNGTPDFDCTWICTADVAKRILRQEDVTYPDPNGWHLFDDLVLLTYYTDAYIALLQLVSAEDADGFKCSFTHLGPRGTTSFNCDKSIVDDYLNLLFTDGTNTQLFFERLYVLLMIIDGMGGYESIKRILAVDFKTTVWNDYGDLINELITELRHNKNLSYALYLNMIIKSFMIRRKTCKRNDYIAVAGRKANSKKKGS